MDRGGCWVIRGGGCSVGRPVVMTWPPPQVSVPLAVTLTSALAAGAAAGSSASERTHWRRRRSVSSGSLRLSSSSRAERTAAAHTARDDPAADRQTHA